VITRRRDLYLITHNTHNKHPCPSAGFEPTISAGERPQIYALVREATGTGDVHKQAYLIQHIANGSKCNG